MDPTPKQTPAVVQAREMLSTDLHPLLDQMIEEYRFAAFKHHGGRFVSPRVIAELILMGWRPTADVPPPR